MNKYSEQEMKAYAINKIRKFGTYLVRTHGVTEWSDEQLKIIAASTCKEMENIMSDIITDNDIFKIIQPS